MDKKASTLVIAVFLTVTMVMQGCGTSDTAQAATTEALTTEAAATEDTITEDTTMVSPTGQEIQLEDGLSTVLHDGDYGFDAFLGQGGASSDAEVIKFLSRNLLVGAEGLSLQSGGFGCSTLSVKSPEGDALFGRNFDWEACDALVVHSTMENAYESIATVNMDFIRQGAGITAGLALMSPRTRTIAALYAPLDGMNEKGFCIAVNMIEDAATIEQNTDKPDLTTTTAVRLLLNQASDVSEAIALLRQYDMHSSMGMMVHFALADSAGRSVVVEYVNNEMIVTETPAVTNFYLAEGEKNGVGSAQSHTRYNILMKQLTETPDMSMENVRDAMDSVSKDSFGEFESTEWSVVYNQSRGEVRYYHRENYGNSYIFQINYPPKH